MNFTSKIDKKLQQKLVTIAVIVFFGLFFWQLTSNIFVPPKVELNQNVSSLTRVVLSPDLKVETIASIQEARSFIDNELENFNIYIDDTSTSLKESGFFVKNMVSREPFDLGYYAIKSATASAVVDLIN